MGRRAFCTHQQATAAARSAAGWTGFSIPETYTHANAMPLSLFVHVSANNPTKEAFLVSLGLGELRAIDRLLGIGRLSAASGGQREGQAKDKFHRGKTSFPRFLESLFSIPFEQSKKTPLRSLTIQQSASLSGSTQRHGINAVQEQILLSLENTFLSGPPQWPPHHKEDGKGQLTPARCLRPYGTQPMSMFPMATLAVLQHSFQKHTLFQITTPPSWSHVRPYRAVLLPSLSRFYRRRRRK